ncbi:MAG: sulfite exporter TauE/SafE family protein [Bacteroidota bacterium]
MEVIYMIAYVLAVFTGIILGVLGGGGSMMILPIFVYILHIDPPLAVVYSLFIVGIASLIGASAHFRLGNVHLRTALIFGIPSIASVILTRKVVLPHIPEVIIDFNWFHLDKNTFLLSFFAFMMLFAAYFMLTDKNKNVKENKKSQSGFGALAFEGIVVGFVTALVGAGGGFLIIPALLYFARLPIKRAIGTSLTIIALNSLIGFASSASQYELDWVFLLAFSAVTSVGILVGTQLSKKIKGQKLKKAFAVMVLILGTFIVVKEFFFK